MTPLGRRAVALAAAAAAAIAFVACLVGLRDHDAFHHMAMGREILAHGFPDREPFLFPMSAVRTGAPPYWLGAVVIYLSQRLFGDGGPVLLAAAVGAVLFLILFLDAAPEMARTRATLLAGAVPLVLALGLWRARTQPRPEMLAVLLLAWTLLAVRRNEAGRGRALLAFPVVAAVWTNVHASVLAGIAAVAIGAATGALHLGLARLLPRRLPAPPAPRQVIVAGGAALAGLLAAAFASVSMQNPVRSGFRFAVTILRTATSAGAAAAPDPVVAYLKHFVIELGPVTLASLREPVGILISALALLTLLSFLLARRESRLREAITVALFAALGSTALRFVPLAAVVTAPIAARNLAAAAGRLEAVRSRRVLASATAGAAAALAAAAIGAAWAPQVAFGNGLERSAFPVRAADYLASMGFGGRPFDTFQFGGYLEWRLGIQVFQDGRGFLRAEDVGPALAGPSDYRRFRALDDRYHFDALVISYPAIDPATAAALSRAAPGQDWGADRSTWSLVAFDDGAMLYLRRDGPCAAQAVRDEYRFAMPANSLSAEQFADRRWAEGFLSDMERSVAEAPRCRSCRVQMGIALVQLGRPADAERVLTAALGGTPVDDRYAFAMLAAAASARGDPRAALAYYRRAAATGIDPAPMRRAAALAALQIGDASAADALVEENLHRNGGSPEDAWLAEMVARRLGAGSRSLDLARKVGTTAARAEALFRQGVAQAMAGNRTGAVAALRDSLAVSERNAAAHAALGDLLRRAGEPVAAARELERALQIDPTLADAHFGRATLLVDRGQTGPASEEFRMYLRLAPRGPRSLEAEEWLRKLEAR